MTSRPGPQEPPRPTARDTRARILDAARWELSRNPDITLAEIARAAEVARRTIYGHFASRASLVEGLAEEAGEAIRRAVAAASVPTADAAAALAHFVVTVWPVGDRYRTLIGLAHKDLGVARVSQLLAPARDTVAGILTQGQRQGLFHANIPYGPLSSALEAHILALLESVNSGIWADNGTGAATSALIVAGVDPDAAASKIRRLDFAG